MPFKMGGNYFSLYNNYIIIMKYKIALCLFGVEGCVVMSLN